MDLGAAMGTAIMAGAVTAVAPLLGQQLPDLLEKDIVFPDLVLAACLCRGSGATVTFLPGITGSRGFLPGLALVAKIGDHTGLHQDTVGFVHQHAKIGDDVTVKLFEDNQAFADLDFKCARGVGESPADIIR